MNALNVMPKNRRRRRGAVALEYILIAALVAIALMGAFLYFRRTLTTGVQKVTDTAAAGIGQSVDEAEKGLTDTSTGFDKTKSP